jgi:hypothetical protein
MSNSMTNDYFSFMSDRWENKQSKRRPLSAVQSVKPKMSTDTIDFVVEEAQIEVVESFVSDTMIQRIFRCRSNTG